MPCYTHAKAQAAVPCFISRSSIRNALFPAQVMSDTHVLESKPFTSGAREKSNHRGPGVPWPKISGATTSSLGGRATFTRRQDKQKCSPHEEPDRVLSGFNKALPSWVFRGENKLTGLRVQLSNFTKATRAGQSKRV